MLAFIVKAVYVLSQVIRMVKEVVKIVIEMKAAKAKVVNALAKEAPEKKGELDKDKTTRVWDLLNYPECEESKYPKSVFFGMPEPEHI